MHQFIITLKELERSHQNPRWPEPRHDSESPPPSPHASKNQAYASVGSMWDVGSFGGAVGAITVGQGLQSVKFSMMYVHSHLVFINLPR